MAAPVVASPTYIVQFYALSFIGGAGPEALADLGTLFVAANPSALIRTWAVQVQRRFGCGDHRTVLDGNPCVNEVPNLWRGLAVTGNQP